MRECSLTMDRLLANARRHGVTDQKIDAFVAGRLEELNDLDLANRPDLLGVLADCLEGEVLTQGKRPADDISSRERT